MSNGGVALGAFALLCLLGLIVLGMWGCPQYSVYQQTLAGEAELANANYARQTQVAQSKAKAEAAAFEADADTVRAHGVARANQIIGEGLTGDAGERYLRYLWIEALKEDGHVIYVPTEAGLPILEARPSGSRREP